jgi:hypothetical protein
MKFVYLSIGSSSIRLFQLLLINLKMDSSQSSITPLCEDRLLTYRELFDEIILIAMNKFGYRYFPISNRLLGETRLLICQEWFN